MLPACWWCRGGRVALLLVWALLLGCANGGPLPVDEPLSWHLRRGALLNPPARFQPLLAAAPRGEVGPIRSSLVEVDGFQGLLVRAGVRPSVLPEDGRRLAPTQAALLLTELLGAEVALRDFGPWRMAAHLLLGVAQGGEEVPREELRARMRRYSGALVLRPDGYLVRATTGEAVQYAGEVELVGGALRAEGFEVGPFYGTRGDRYLYRLEEDLGHHPDARVAGVAMPDTGTVGPVLEGMGQAVVETVEGIAALVLRPGESLAGLAKLPASVRTLLESSPEYWARYRAMPQGEQVRQASRLLTHVLLVCGTAGMGGAKAAAMAMAFPSGGMWRRPRPPMPSELCCTVRRFAESRLCIPQRCPREVQEEWRATSQGSTGWGGRSPPSSVHGVPSASSRGFRSSTPSSATGSRRRTPVKRR